MSFLRDLFGGNGSVETIERPTRIQPPARDAGFQLDGLSLQAEDVLLEQIAGLGGARISRSDALRVPAVTRARNIIAGTIAGLPINLHARDRSIDERTSVVRDPDPELEHTVVYALTVEDLLFEGKSYWLVTRFVDGFPADARHIDLRAVHEDLIGFPSEVISQDHQFSPRSVVFIDGQPVPRANIIRFISPNPPLLTHTAQAIRTALLLDQAARLYSKDPLPLGFFSDQEEADPLEDDEITKILDDWEAARRKRAWGYVGGLKPNMLQWDPQKLQLAEARQHAVLEIARATGLDPEEIGVHTTTRTYQNAEQRRMDLIDFVLMAYMRAVEDRLSRGDVTPRGVTASFDPTGFLRADFASRMSAYKDARETGALTEDEIRELENRPSIRRRSEPVGDQGLRAVE